ncbi:MAG: phage tail protein [Nitrospiraceae bacterium]
MTTNLLERARTERGVVVRVVDNVFEADASAQSAVICAAGRTIEAMIPERVRVQPEWMVIENGRVIPRTEWERWVVAQGSEVICIRRVHGATGRIIAGVMLIAIGILLAQPELAAEGGLITAAWISGAIGAGLVVGGAAELIMGAPSLPSSQITTVGDQESSPTYGFGGIVNSLRPGAPIGVVYGEHRVAGQIVTAFARAVDDNDVLYLLIAIGEGQITSIADILINDQSVANYRNVEIETRDGQNAQSVIAIFAGESGATYGADALIANGSWLTYTTIGTAVEAIELNLVFPQGLFALDTSGGFTEKSVTFQIEIKLSSSGTWDTALPGGPTPQVPGAPSLAAGPTGTWAGTLVESGIDPETGNVVYAPVGGDYGVLGGQGYAYRISFVTKYGETVAGAAATFVGSAGTGYQVDVTVPTGDSTTIARRIYRNGALIADVLGNAAAVYRDGYLSAPSVQVVPASDQSVPRTKPLTVTDARRAVLRRTYRIDALVPGKYDVRITRTNAETISSREADQVRRSTVNEIVKDAYTYPNTALIGVKALATDQLSGGLPKITSLVRGRRVRVFTTATVYAIDWTANPAWVAFDILSSERFGLGRSVAPVRVKSGVGTVPSLTVTNGVATATIVGAVVTADKVQKGDQVFVDAQGLVGIVSSYNATSQQITFTANWTGANASGLAFEVRRPDLDIASFLAWAAFCNELVQDGSGGYERRAEVNIVLDADGQSAWDAVMKLSGIGFAALVKMGTAIRVKIERAASPAQLFTMGNIKAGSFNELFLPLKDRANIYEGQFLNRENDYQQDTVTYEDPAVFTNVEVARRQTVGLFGVTSPTQAARLLRFYELANRYLTRTIDFEVDVDAVAVEAGDAISFQHDVPQWGFGGRAGSGSAAGTIVLDRTVTVVDAVTYQVMVQHADDSIETKTVASVAGVYSTLAIVGTWATTPVQGEKFSFGAVAVVTKPFRVIAISRTGDLKAKITAIEYNESLYSNFTPIPVTDFQYSALADFAAPPGNVLNLALLQQADTPFALWASWSSPGSVNFRGARVYRVLPSGVEVLLGDSFNGSFAIEGLAVGDAVTIKVTSVGPAGAETNRATAPTATAILTEAKPPNVTGFSLAFESGIAYLQWASVVWVRPVEYEIRKGTTWETGINLGRVAVNYVAAAGDGTYWIAARDTVTGAYSATPVSLLVGGSVQVGNVVATWGEDETLWPGTVSGGAVINVSDNVLQLEGSGDFDSQSDVDAIVNLDALGGIVAGPGAYEVPAAHIVDLGSVKIATITASFVARGDNLSALWDDQPDFDLWADVDGDYADKIGVQMYLATSDAAGVFGPWVPFSPGQYSGRKFKMKIEIVSYDANVTPVVTSFDWTVDMPDRIEEMIGLVVAAGGTAVVFSPAFQIVPSTVVTISAATAGDDILLTAETASGFTVQIKNGGVGVGRTVNTLSKGY